MLRFKKLVFGLIFFSSLELRLFGAHAGDLSENSGDGRASAREGERTGAELRRRTRSSSGRDSSKGSESEVELTTPSTDRICAKELLPKSGAILEALIAKDSAQLGRLVAKFTKHRLAKLSFPVLIPYGQPGGSSFAIYAVQTKQSEALKILAQVEDFTMPDRLRRTPMSVALELERRDASYGAIITTLEELHKETNAAR